MLSTTHIVTGHMHRGQGSASATPKSATLNVIRSCSQRAQRGQGRLLSTTQSTSAGMLALALN
jgi:hypothetical protein